MKLRPKAAFWLAFLGIALCVTVLPIDTHPTSHWPHLLWPAPPILSLFLVGIFALVLLLYFSMYITGRDKDDRV